MKQTPQPENGRMNMRQLEYWLLGGWIAWVAAVYTLEAPDGGWGMYFLLAGLVALSQLPAIFYIAVRSSIAALASWKQVLIWLLLFPAGLFGIALGMEKLHIPGILNGCFVIAAMGTMVLEVVVLLHTLARRKAVSNHWFRRISLEKALLFTVILIAVTLAVMAVSSMDDPKYHETGFLLIGFEFSVPAIIRHWWTFISFTLQFTFMYACGYFFFIINSRVLVAQVLRKHGIVFYAGGLLAVAGLCYPFVAQLLLWLPVNQTLGGIFHSNPFVMENAFAAIMIMLISLPLVVALQWGRQNSRIAALEKEKAQAELDLLKQQLNPHFFFNTLNNLYALSLTQSGKTPDSILRLSELMRYVIYKGKEAEVRVEEEAQYLENYIGLEEIRLKRQADIRFEQDIRSGTRTIAPLLLAVLVENAFKHGVEPSAGGAMLHMDLYADDRQLRFRCENSFEPGGEKVPGIGLGNLRRRLGLLYPGRHSLHTGAKNHTFIAELIIDFT